MGLFYGGGELRGAGGLPALILLPSPWREGGAWTYTWVELPRLPTSLPCLPPRGPASPVKAAEGLERRLLWLLFCVRGWGAGGCACHPSPPAPPCQLKGPEFQGQVLVCPLVWQMLLGVLWSSLGLLWPQLVQPRSEPLWVPLGSVHMYTSGVHISWMESPGGREFNTLPVIHGSKTKLSRKNDKTLHSKICRSS